MGLYLGELDERVRGRLGHGPEPEFEGRASNYQGHGERTWSRLSESYGHAHPILSKSVAPKSR